MLEPNRIYCGDCLDVMTDIEAGSVDLILTDLPYGTTHCAWDTVIPFAPLWEQYKRVIKPNGAILLFSAQPFTTDLIASNRKMFRYEIIWEKTQKSGFLNARKMPLRAHENICVFYKCAPTYNPQMIPVERKGIGRIRCNSNGNSAQQYNGFGNPDWKYVETGKRYPADVIKFSNWNGALFGKTDNATKHPTQKPVALLEWIIRTYTNPGDLVLDSCVGSGSTPVACIGTERDFIGIEKDKQIYAIAQERITSLFRTETLRNQR